MKRIAPMVAVMAVGLATWVGTASAGAAGFTQCPPVDKDPGCQFLINATDNGVAVAEEPVGPYDAEDDTLVGIENTSSKPITAIPISSTEPIFGFDGDGMCEPPELPRSTGCVVLPDNSAHEPQSEHGKPCPVSEAAPGAQ